MTTETIYDHPLYYDILFGWDRDPEANFYDGLLRACGARPGAPVLEVACGTGQVGRRLARLGWAVTGLDISPGMLAFLAQQADTEGVRVRTVEADMESFEAADSFVAAINPMSSFRLLHDRGAAARHLRSVARALRPGGVYLLDMDFVGRADAPAITTDESWELTRGAVRVQATEDGVVVDDAGVARSLAWGSGGHLRPYTVAEFVECVGEAAELEIRSWHRESGRNPEGVSVFDSVGSAEPAGVGRAMVALARVSR